MGRGFRFSHATVAKDAKVNKKEAIRSDLSGLCVRGFFTPRAQGLIEMKEYLAALADFA